MFDKKHRTVVTEAELYLQRQSTRVYFLFLSLALFILVIYTSLTYQSNSNSVKISSLQNFQRLQQLYGPTAVECPCSRLSVDRATFHQVEPIFHQVCSSDFVSSDWLDSLFNSYANQNASETNSYTFAGTGFAHFQSLRLICDLTRQAVNDARDLFLETQVVSASMLNYDLFDGLTSAALTSFQSTVSNSFIQSLQLLLGMAQGNGLVSGYSTNWGVFLPNMTKDATIYTKARLYGNCNCATSISCVQPAVPEVAGFVVGCLPLETFLQSTFECLYNQSCVELMSTSINALNVPRALVANRSRFTPSLPANRLVEEMFIESWSLNISYANFFRQCAPVACSYKLIERYNILYVVTTIVGLYGGLTVLLKLVVPLGVRQMYAIARRHRLVQPHNTPADERY